MSYWRSSVGVATDRSGTLQESLNTTLNTTMRGACHTPPPVQTQYDTTIHEHSNTQRSHDHNLSPHCKIYSSSQALLNRIKWVLQAYISINKWKMSAEWHILLFSYQFISQYIYIPPLHQTLHLSVNHLNHLSR